MKINEVKYGAILSYILIIINSAYGFMVTPYILSTIGTSEFGVYKTIASLTAVLMVLDLGIGGMTQRYISKFKSQNKSEEINNFAAMGLIQSLLISLVIIIVSSVIFFTLDSLYGASFTTVELLRAKQLFIILVISMIIHVIGNLFQGIIAGFNRFIFINTIKILSIMVRSLLLFIVLPMYKNSITIVLISLSLEVCIILISLVYTYFKLHVKIQLIYWDQALFKQTFIYAMMLFVQSIVSQVNSNLDNVVVGSLIGTAAVTIYSFGLLIFNMFQQLSAAMSSVLLPTVMDIIHVDKNDETLKKLIIKVGKIQFILLSAALIGFVLVGKEFVFLWLGKQYKDVWLITLILMIPALWELSSNTLLAILRAKNRLAYRTKIMVFITFLNLVITVLGTMTVGYIAAAFGTATSTVLYMILMGFYYYKKLNINLIIIFSKIISRIIPSLIIPTILLLILNNFLYGTWINLIIKIVVFCIAYFIVLWLWGLDRKNKVLFESHKKE